MTKIKNFSVYLIAPVLALALFVILFQLWKTNLNLPLFSYDGDALFVLFVVKTIIKEGWFFSNSQVGLPHFGEIFYFHDFPLHADSFHFLIFKFFSYFSSNPFFVLNCYFLSTFFLISLTAFAALKSFKISNFTAIIIGILYAFMPYHMARGVNHAFLSNYAVIPLIIMSGLWLVQNKISMISLNQKQQYCFAPNRYFFYAVLIAIFSAINGVYYAFYACVIFIFSWFLSGLKRGNFFDHKSIAALFLSLLIISSLILIYLPSLLYWLENGLNGGVGNRGVVESEFYGLKIINLFLPHPQHYINYFANLRQVFDDVVGAGERAAAGLGIVGSCGFLFLLMWLIAKTQSEDSSKTSFLQKTIHKFSLGKDEENLINNLAGLNLLSVLFSTSGGLVMFVSMTFPLIRSHARFSIFIAFFSLTLMAIIFDKIIERKIFNKKIIAQILILLIGFLALFDQVGRVSATYSQPQKLVDKFNSDQKFIAEVEKNIPTNSAILNMPFLRFPEGETYENAIGYLHAQSLRWSYPAMAERPSAKWQENLSNLSFKEFISEIKKAGFNGVFIDRIAYAEKYSWKNLRKLEANLKVIAKGHVIASDNARLVFFAI